MSESSMCSMTAVRHLHLVALCDSSRRQSSADVLRSDCDKRLGENDERNGSNKTVHPTCGHAGQSRRMVSVWRVYD
jgi:hypothetical protein